MLENVKKKKGKKRRRRSCLALNKKKREKKLENLTFIQREVAGWVGGIRWRRTVDRPGRGSAGEREREREFLAGEVWTRERKMPAGGDGIRWRTADRPGRGSAGRREREREREREENYFIWTTKV
jgi:hypothetical protein